MANSNFNVDVVGTGFTVLDRIYADGALADEALGGSCGNVLVSLAMLHRHVAPVIALGDDDTGESLVKEFAEAGALIDYITRYNGLRSPIVSQQLDTGKGTHRFSFVCPETHQQLPRYKAISVEDLNSALPVLAHCSVFYSDRISSSIVVAMRMAKAAGAIVFFEPSAFEEGSLFNEAIGLADILKYSEDRLGKWLADLKADLIRIVTHGAAGLEVCDRSGAYWLNAIEAPRVLDTCGSGDMVSVGIIDWMLSNDTINVCSSATEILQGVIAGQRLAAANCAFAGARGLFKARGANYARQILREKPYNPGRE
jgi:fructokinase